MLKNISSNRIGLLSKWQQIGERKVKKKKREIYGKIFKLKNPWQNGRVDSYVVEDANKLD